MSSVGILLSKEDFPSVAAAGRELEAKLVEKYGCRLYD
jgi:hypothetical protein